MKFRSLFPPLILIFSLGLSSQVHAMTLKEAKSQLQAFKAQGKVGEKVNGFLAVIQNRKSTQNLVKLINKARLQQYEKIALEHNLTLQEVENLAGKKTAQKAKPGHYIQQKGQWVKK